MLKVNSRQAWCMQRCNTGILEGLIEAVRSCQCTCKIGVRMCQVQLHCGLEA